MAVGADGPGRPLLPTGHRLFDRWPVGNSPSALIGPPFCDIVRFSTGRSGDRPLRSCIDLRFDTISRLKSLIGKAAVPAAFSAQNAENASHTEPLRALWRYENL